MSQDWFANRMMLINWSGVKQMKKKTKKICESKHMLTGKPYKRKGNSTDSPHSIYLNGKCV